MTTFDVTYDKGFPEVFAPYAPKNRGFYRNSGAGAYLIEKTNSLEGGKETQVRFPWFWPICFRVKKILPNLTQGAIDEYHKQMANLQLLMEKKLPIELPEDFFHYQPYDHQWLGLCQAAASYRWGWLYDMGLGKTKMAIDTHRIKKIIHDKPDFSTLVVTPKVTFPSWKSEIPLHGKDELSHLFYLGSNRDRKLFGMDVENPVDRYDFVITTYATMRNSWQELQSYGFDCVVFDESHNLRTPTSSQSNAALNVSRAIPHRCIMSGTPMTKPEHMFVQLKVLDNGMIPEKNWTRYKDKFIKTARHNPHMVIGYKNMDLLRRRVNSVCIARKKADCLDLPNRQIIDVPWRLDLNSRRHYNSIVKDYCLKFGPQSNEVRVELPPGNGATQVIALGQVSRGWYRENRMDPNICDGCEHLFSCVSHKIQPYTTKCKVVQKKPEPLIHGISANFQLTLASFLMKILSGDSTNKIIVFFSNNHTLDMCKQAFDAGAQQEENTTHIRSQKMKGGMDYEAILSEFNNDNKCRVLFCQIKCAIGWTATGANYTVYAEPTLNPDFYKQSMDRNYRPGQNRKVTVYRILMEGTLDAGVYQGLDQGLNLGSAIADGRYCEKCEAEGKCVLNMSAQPGISRCSLKGFIKKSKLNIRGVE